MGLKEILIGLSFILIFEGLPLFLSPSRYKILLMQVSELNDSLIRSFGLFLVILGVIILNFL